jgi:hypothetical protein
VYSLAKLGPSPFCQTNNIHANTYRVSHNTLATLFLSNL